MALAEVFEAVVGAGCPGASSRPTTAARPGRPDAPVDDRGPVAGAPSPTSPRRRATSAWPGPTWPATWTSTATCTTALVQLMARSPTSRPAAGASSCGLLRALGGRKLLLRPAAAAAAGGASRRWLTGPLHSKTRDAEAISHHYDVSNRFYEWVLGPSMAYTCAVYPDARTPRWRRRRRTSSTWSPASWGCEPGMRLLDVGCGWGGMVMHAAKQYGVKALGVTLSRQQAEWAQRRHRARAGCPSCAEVRHLDYRDVPETGFDAVSSIGLTEHIGKQQPAVLLLVPVRRS